MVAIEDVDAARGCRGLHSAGGQQWQVGRRTRLGEKSAPRSSKGRVIGLSRSWKMLGKKARMKIARKRQVFRRLLSNGIGSEVSILSSVERCDVRWDS